MLGTAALSLSTWANAAAQVPQVSEIPIEVQVLEASNVPFPAGEDGGSSHAARDLSSTLNYKYYRSLSTERRALGPGEAARFSLSNQTGVVLTLVSSEPNHSIRLKVQTQQAGHGIETEYSIRKGGTVFLSAGASGAEAVLVLAVTAKGR